MHAGSGMSVVGVALSMCRTIANPFYRFWTGEVASFSFMSGRTFTFTLAGLAANLANIFALAAKALGSAKVLSPAAAAHIIGSAKSGLSSLLRKQ
ncbi:hypothetical protein [Cupriavidus taiwanensis]|uniref:hypothetical protein n=1 Tax=Cupriavidus taiwanensis TaxID=164546 RepID=UPI0018DB3FD6|nr:hypothetical protein [Cupriavidus taiwanensis]